MTVGHGSGDGVGDSAQPIPEVTATVRGSPETVFSGKFWLLGEISDDEDSGRGAFNVSTPSSRSLQYLCRTPSPAADRDLREDARALSRRTSRRLERRRQQRLAAIELAAGRSSPSEVIFPQSHADLDSYAKKACKANPVLQPSTFLDDGSGGWTVVQRRRRTRTAVIADAMAPVDPLFQRFSKFNQRRPKPRGPRLGPCGPLTAESRPQARVIRARGPLSRLHASDPKTNAPVAGLGGRNFVGFSPDRIDLTSEHRRLMNRGGGRGQGRGGAGGGRGRGNGNGWGGGRNQGGFARNGNGNFFQGESSGTNGNRDDFEGDRFQQANGDFGNFNGGANFNNNNGARRNGYVNNQRRGGYQNRYQGGNNGPRNGNGGAGYRANNGGGANYVPRRDAGGVDQNLIQKTVQAVVAAMAAATQNNAVVADVAGTSGQGVGPVAPQAAPRVVAAPPVVPAAIPPAAATQAAVPPAAAIPTAAATAPGGPVAEGTIQAKKKKIDNCFRCKQPGHFIDDCTVQMCEICESIHHASPACHLLQAPKPHLIMYGYADDGLVFFELPMSGAFRPKTENAKLAKLTIEGDAMTIPEIIEQLKWIVPSENFQWEVTHFHNNVFKVKFPSKTEVQRMKHFKTYPVPGKPTDMDFDEWGVMEEPIYMLPEVWVRVTGLPSDVRSDFFALWAVGYLFGKTMEVDMAFTRKNKALRIKIGCMDPTLIPPSMDLFLRRGFFRVGFEVESVMVTQDEEMTDVNKGKGDEGGNDGGDGGNNGGNGGAGDGKGKEVPTDMEVEQTHAPNVSQEQSMQAGGGANDSMVQTITFGCLPPSPIRPSYDVRNTIIGCGSVQKEVNAKSAGASASGQRMIDTLMPVQQPLPPSGAAPGHPGADVWRVRTPSSTRSRAATGTVVADGSPVTLAAASSPVTKVLSHDSESSSNFQMASVYHLNESVFLGSCEQRNEQPDEVVSSKVVMSTSGNKVNLANNCVNSTVQMNVNVNHLDGFTSESPMFQAVELEGASVMASMEMPLSTTEVECILNSASTVCLDVLGCKENGGNLNSLSPSEKQKLQPVAANGKLNGVSSVTCDDGACDNNNKVAVSFDGSLKNAENIDVIPSLDKCSCDVLEHYKQVLNGADGPSMEEVIAFGGIPRATQTEVRSSTRIRAQHNADETQLARAMQQAQSRDDATVSGTKPVSNLSFVNMQSSEILGKASRIGVRLGKDFDEAVETIDCLKRIEENRNLHFLNKNIEENIARDNGPSNFMMSNVSNLCEDLVEDEFEDIELNELVSNPLPPIKEKKTRQRKIYDNTHIRKSNRKRIKKIY